MASLACHLYDEKALLADGAPQEEKARVLSVALIDAHPLECEGLASMLRGSEQFSCTGAWTDPQMALTILPQLAPRVILLDAKLPGISSFLVLRAARAASPRSRVVYMVDCSEEQCVISPALTQKLRRQAGEPPTRFVIRPDDCLQTALKLGARGVVRKQCTFEHLTTVIRTVASGGIWMEPSTAARLAEQYLSFLQSQSPRRERLRGGLTRRECQIVEMIGHGHSNKEIADRLGLAYATVKNSVSSILRKLRLGDRTQIALYAAGTTTSPEETGAGEDGDGEGLAAWGPGNTAAGAHSPQAPLPAHR